LYTFENQTKDKDKNNPNIEFENNRHIQSFIGGIRLTHKNLLDIFGKHGLQKVQCQGAKFDPNLHQQLSQAPTTEQPEGTIIQVLSDGYTLHDQVLRHAQVQVVVLPSTNTKENDKKQE